MIKTLSYISIVLLIMIKHDAVADNFVGTMDVFESAPELKPYFDNAFAYAVFPTVGKGGFALGISHGKGRVYQGDQVLGDVVMTELSLGFQFGGQAFSEIIFLQDQRALDEFTSGRFEFDASASAIVLTFGAQARAGTDGASASSGVGPASTKQVEYGFNKGMAVFIHPLGGLMYEASIGGQKFSFSSAEAEIATDAAPDEAT